MLVAAGIEASRKDAEKGTEITFRKIPVNDCSDSSDDESGEDKPDLAGIKDQDDSRSNSRSASNSSPDSSVKPRSYAESGITGNTGNRNGDTWANDPMRFYSRGGTA